MGQRNYILHWGPDPHEKGKIWRGMCLSVVTCLRYDCLGLYSSATGARGDSNGGQWVPRPPVRSLALTASPPQKKMKFLVSVTRHCHFGTKYSDYMTTDNFFSVTSPIRDPAPTGLIKVEMLEPGGHCSLYFACQACVVDKSIRRGKDDK